MKMKNRPIFQQILIGTILLTIFILAIIAFWIPNELRDFFTNEAFQTIKLSQNMYIGRVEDESDVDSFGNGFGNRGQNGRRRSNYQDNIREVNHLFYYNEMLYLTKYPDAEIAKQLLDDAKKQREETKNYEIRINDSDLFYTITKLNVFGSEGIIISYLTETYRDSLTNLLFSKIIIISIISVILSMVPAFFFAKRISRPIETLEKKVNTLATNIREEEINLDRKDEIGRLADSIENLRKELIRKDESEKNFLQNTSHELKTPVMVIQSYAEAINDKIYPKGDLVSSVDVIIKESAILKDKIANLLMYNRLEYLKSHDDSKENLRIDLMIEETLERFRLLKPEIVIDKNIEKTEIFSNKESWMSLIENLLDNQFRYAKTNIQIVSSQSEDETYISFYNDGEEISDEQLETLFDKFKKGKDGKFGLGLAIVKSVAESSGFDIDVENDNGVRFNLRSIDIK